MEQQFKVIGVMSGTSLDGIDLAEITLTRINNTWNYKLHCCKTHSYSRAWVNILKNAYTFNKQALTKLNFEYTQYLGKVIFNFISQNNIKNIDAVCSHGHTILHKPHKGITLQIGNLPELAKYVKQTVVCDFRVQDVLLGGQGAPLVPIGDQLLFNTYDFCINLGGFANISFQKNGQRIAYDNCPVNVVLNYYAEKLGFKYDENGNIARSGSLNLQLLNELNSIPFYKQEAPKSLGIEWVKDVIFPILNKYHISEKDLLHTFVAHIAQIINNDIISSGNSKTTSKNILVTGGGAFNSFLIEQLQMQPNISIDIKDKQLIEYKEALIFGLLGVLKLNNEINILASVTGANKNHSSGNIFYYTNGNK